MAKVIVYSTQTCPYCDMAKDFLKKHGIEFTEYDVNENPEKAREMFAKTGQNGVPVLDIGGKIIIGFDEEAIKEALNIK